MTRAVGILTKDEDGQLCVKGQLSPANPELYDIPLEEIFEEFIGKKVVIDIVRITDQLPEDGGK
jgi:hypothetical protein